MKSIQDILEVYNSSYHETNPLSNIIESVREAGFVVKEPQYASVDYEKSSRIILEIENGSNVLVNLYRMPSGRYEVNSYSTGSIQTNSQKNRIR